MERPAKRGQPVASPYDADAARLGWTGELYKYVLDRQEEEDDEGSYILVLPTAFLLTKAGNALQEEKRPGVAGLGRSNNLFRWDKDGSLPVVFIYPNSGKFEVSEGNHRIAEMNANGRDWIPVKIKILNTGMQDEAKLKKSGNSQWIQAKLPTVKYYDWTRYWQQNIREVLKQYYNTQILTLQPIQEDEDEEQVVIFDGEDPDLMGAAINCSICERRPARYKCARCVAAFYCGEDCQRTDWHQRGHAKRCI
jgi:hypothetical protein